MWAETSLRWIDRALPDPDRPKEQFSEIATDGRRAGAVMEGIRVNFKEENRIRTWFDVNGLIDETLPSCTPICSSIAYWFVRNRKCSFRRSGETEFSSTLESDHKCHCRWQ
jgi:hypothetical protein